ncbi:TonB-dependent receptor [Methyloversatilis thermotolerans]|uniref:TonB-dependent receptor n=1 Tax=Methyloversatilis thermotolerans TaxID=1346290 RepID=UPI0003745219|nr:TonB-dependent receptor [Methyloversatilis thermotolerans]
MRCGRALGLLPGLIAACAPLASAQQGSILLAPVPVRAERMSELSAEGHSTTEIDAEDIERSAATSVAELIAREANVNLQSLFGHDKRASLDLRGMGETAMSNVIILVDGVRLNEIDLSGSDLSTLALSRIERIRIVRGGGAVRVGDGAVGGVIDITTRRPEAGRVTGSMRAEAGAYGTRKLDLSVAAGNGPLSLALRAARSDSDGFRRNGYLYARDGSAELRFTPDAPVSAFVRISRHVDEYGLPGPLPAAVLSQRASARRATANPDDGGRTDDMQYVAGGDIDFGRFGVSRLQASARRRDNPFVASCDGPPCSEAPIHSSRNALQFDHQIDIPSMVEARPHRIGIGVNNWNGDYARYSGDPATVGTNRVSGDVHSHGGYADLSLRVAERWTVHGGARIDRFRSRRVTETLRQPTLAIPVPPFVMPCASCPPVWTASEATSDGRWRNHARELGMRWEASDALSLHLSTTRHFRSPNIDELALAEATLRPQHGSTTEAGFTYRPGARRELALSVFRMRIEDEIHYGPEQLAGGESRNRNLPVPTVRHGLEFQLRWPLANRLEGALNFGYVRPRLQGLDMDVPSVPRRTASARLNWQMSDSLDLTLAVRHASSSADGNAVDASQTFARLASWTVADAGMRWAPAGLHGRPVVTLAINNLFDRAYATKQYNGSVYPMPDRHFMLGCNTSF